MAYLNLLFISLQLPLSALLLLWFILGCCFLLFWTVQWFLVLVCDRCFELI